MQQQLNMASARAAQMMIGLLAAGNSGAAGVSGLQQRREGRALELQRHSRLVDDRRRLHRKLHKRAVV